VRLTKQQLEILDSVRNGGYVWVSAGCPYLARKRDDGHFKSELINNKTFTALRDSKAIIPDPDHQGRFVLGS